MTGTITYTCPFVPREWIAAHGLTPSRIMPESRNVRGETEGACPFMSAFIEAASRDGDTAGIVVTTACDQMRRGYDLLKREADIPVFLMHVPTTWRNASARELYASELRRLGAFLADRGGASPSPGTLAAIMRENDGRRSTLLDAQVVLSDRAFAEVVAEFNRTGDFLLSGEPAPETRPLRLALLGGPLLREQLALFDVIATGGGSVVLDGCETSERTLPRPFDHGRLADDPFVELADAYFGSIPDVSRRPHTGLYEWLERELPSRNVQGVILVRQVWCDLWHAEAARLKEWLDVPLLDLDLDELGVEARAITRIEAFLEMLA